MRRSTKIIQINGFRGILTAIFVVTCLGAGFVLFPGYVAMNIWNYFAGSSFQNLNIYQGVLLWAIIAIVGLIINKHSFSISFARPKELNEDEMNDLMERIQMQTQAKIIDQMILKNIDKVKKETPEIKTNISSDEENKVVK